MANVQAVAPTSSRTYPYTVLILALVTASAGLIGIRLATNEGMPSVIVVAIRLGLAVAVFTPLVLRRHLATVRQLARRDWLMLGLAGLLFASDLTMFSESVKHTSILLATVVGGLSPLWTALLERFILRTALHRAIYVGLTLALTGGILIALSGSSNSSSLGSNPVLGGVLALMSGLSAAAYLIVARTLRPHIPLRPYIWLVFGTATLVALAAAFAAGVSLTGHSPEAYFWTLLSAIASQLIAHPSFGFVVAYLSPTFISISSQLITLIASVMAFFLFREIPGVGELLGSAIILAGVIFAIVGQAERKSR